MIGHTDRLAAALIAGLVLKMMLPALSRPLFYGMVLFVPVALALGRRFRFSSRLSFFVVPAAAYCVTAAFSGLQYVLVRSDIVKMLTALTFVSALSLARMSSPQRQQFERWLHRTVYLVALAGAALGLMKLGLLLRGAEMPFLVNPIDGSYPEGSALQTDYNIFALALLFGLVSAAWLWRREENRLILNLSHAGVPLLVAAVALSGSRRGLIFLVCGAIVWTLSVRRQRLAPGGAPGARPARVAWVRVLPAYLAMLLVVVLQWGRIESYVGDLLSSAEYARLSSRAESIRTGDMLEPRLVYWERAVDVIASATWPEWVVGSGFGYLADFGRFSGLDEDYPHNVFLSAVLYGGFLQSGMLLLMLMVALRRFLVSPGDAGALGAWLVLEVAFLFFSSNSFFSSEFAMVLSLLALALPTAVGVGAAVPRRAVRRWRRQPLARGA